jgi:hypothetical protein
MVNRTGKRTQNTTMCHNVTVTVRETITPHGAQNLRVGHHIPHTVDTARTRTASDWPIVRPPNFCVMDMDSETDRDVHPLWCVRMYERSAHGLFYKNNDGWSTHTHTHLPPPPLLPLPDML